MDVIKRRLLLGAVRDAVYGAVLVVGCALALVWAVLGFLAG
jgi:hypothetical protein